MDVYGPLEATEVGMTSSNILCLQAATHEHVATLLFSKAGMFHPFLDSTHANAISNTTVTLQMQPLPNADNVGAH